MADGPWVLVVVPDGAEREAVAEALGGEGYRVVASATPAEGLATAGRDVAVVVVDDAVTDPSIVHFVRTCRAELPRAEFLVASRDGERRAQAAGLGRASDYVEQPWAHPRELVRSVGHAVQAGALRLANAGTRTPVGLLGHSGAIARVRELVASFASSDREVLLTGESGVGKEVVAGMLHEQSRRRGEFVRVNCAALPKDLIEAELFGAKDGSYTGQKGAREGLFGHADDGTLFLDEIGEMPLEVQPSLLRVLESRAYRPVGAQRESKATARVIAATNVDLPAAIARGAFRQDLYYRLDKLVIPIPPLRERPEDIPLLARHFVRTHAAAERRNPMTLSDDAVAQLVAYRWPGNVRELSNVLLRAVILCRDDVIGCDDLAPGGEAPRGRPASGPARPRVPEGSPWEALLDLPLQQARELADAAFTREYLGRRLAATGGNISRAAAQAEVLRPNFKRLMRRHGVGAGGPDAIVDDDA